MVRVVRQGGEGGQAGWSVRVVRGWSGVCYKGFRNSRF